MNPRNGGPGSKTHYDVLGVSSDATEPELHRAYRAQAARRHPDLNRDSTEERDAAEHDMRELNHAWYVLSDPGRRTLYDRLLAPPAGHEPAVRRVPPSSSPAPSDLGFSHADRWPRTFLVVPLVLLLLAPIAMIVFTAYADDRSDTTAVPPGSSAELATTVRPTVATVGDCVIVRGGHVSQVVGCDGPNDGQVTAEVPRAHACPDTRNRAVDGQDGSSSLCLLEPRGP
jgi:hypothetical protein